jgi:hypothetical protein
VNRGLVQITVQVQVHVNRSIGSSSCLHCFSGITTSRPKTKSPSTSRQTVIASDSRYALCSENGISSAPQETRNRATLERWHAKHGQTNPDLLIIIFPEPTIPLIPKFSPEYSRSLWVKQHPALPQKFRRIARKENVIVRFSLENLTCSRPCSLVARATGFMVCAYTTDESLCTSIKRNFYTD